MSNDPSPSAETPEQLIARLEYELRGFTLESQAYWTYENRNTSAHALLRDCLALLRRGRSARPSTKATEEKT